MKLSSILVFIFSFGILTLLAEKITHHEKREGLESNDPGSVPYRGALMKRGASRRNSGLCSYSVSVCEREVFYSSVKYFSRT